MSTWGEAALLSEVRTGLKAGVRSFRIFCNGSYFAVLQKLAGCERGVTLHENPTLNAMTYNLFLRVSDVELYLVYHGPDTRVLKYGVDILYIEIRYSD